MDYQNAIFQWEEGRRRLDAAQGGERLAQERVTARLVDELRRRLGGPFAAGELAELYGRGTEWCLEVAVQVAPDAPWAWDASTVVDAAFARYLREATDYAGGRLVQQS